MLMAPGFEALTLYFAHRQAGRKPGFQDGNRRRPILVVTAALAIGGVLYAIYKMSSILLGISHAEAYQILRGAGATFLRVEFTLFLAALWTIPTGVYIGLKPTLAKIAQPTAQIAAAAPAPALFPVVLVILVRAGGGLWIGSIVLLLLGTQWYMLFNVIAGATAIPADLKEVCQAFHLSRIQRWKSLLLPAIFPYL